MRSRVVRARSSTIAVRWPTMRLNRVLLPTFGRPTMATMGSGITARLWAMAAAMPFARHVEPLPLLAERAACGRELRQGSGPAGRSGRRRERGRGQFFRLCRRCRRARHAKNPLGNRAKILDRSGRAASYTDHLGAREYRLIGQVRLGLDLDRPCPDDCRTNGSAPWCWHSTVRPRRPSGPLRARLRSCPPGAGS